jgi:fumarate reductase subunit C
MKNPKVVVYSIIALGFLALSFLVDWIFIIPAVILMILNQKELMKKK